MRYYALRERRGVERSKWSGSFHLDRQWGLPGVKCPTCRETWAGVGYDYPSVDLSSLTERRELERAQCVPWEQFVKLRERVLPLVPPGAVVEPGTGFGALTGRAKGKFPPVVIHMPWLLLIQPAVLARLKGLTGAIPVPTRFKARPGVADLVELEVQPGGSIRGVDAGNPCRTCGRGDSEMPLPPVDEMSLEKVPTVDFARVFRTIVVVSERVLERLGRDLEESEIQAVDVTSDRSKTTVAQRSSVRVSS
ncbi:double-CXXCG motif protein [Myxococcus sp. MISCRS1]|uniref:SitI6 family double-CXXCG motif immunity protein n=1 Tax=Myxococcus sp. MISCRS1 TaxID=2996786 RepID=UPI00226E07A0|nr:double-CXXCG motif protein [Myxococcus sp. MISCRS1]MCY1003923.1 double-CXXCG motif protein [Myxococcus sp. MISCRS1]